MRYDRWPGLLVLCSLLAAGAVRGQVEGARLDYRDPAIPTARRVEDLLARMTPGEKVGQMLCLWDAKRPITDARRRFDPARRAGPLPPDDRWELGRGGVRRAGRGGTVERFTLA